jgi:phosphohistidine phosphatase
MKLILIRHARAEERALFRRDRTRALTEDGRRRMRKAARGLCALLSGVSQIATSPLLRARQTAEIIASVCDGLKVAPLPELAPGVPARDLLAWLHTQPEDAVLALVGHEPDLGQLAGLLLCGRSIGFIKFKKGAAALIEFADAPAAGKGTLTWLLTATQLSAQKD